eukprot:3667281-Rhodomonas_salina.1
MPQGLDQLCAGDSRPHHSPGRPQVEQPGLPPGCSGLDSSHCQPRQRSARLCWPVKLRNRRLQ